MDAVGTRDMSAEAMRTILASGHTLPPWEPPGERQCVPTRSVAPQARSLPQSAKKPRAAGRFKTLNRFVDFSLEGLTRADVVTWLILFRDTKDGVARTSQADVARRGGLSLRATNLAVKNLGRLGLVQVVFQGGLKRGTSHYRVVPVGDPS